ncbi:MAG: hypothetical protein Q8R27_00665, partial [Phenylobacterium sp.]|nr:hypothetical protein [Phenylobacterium sp.]
MGEHRNPAFGRMISDFVRQRGPAVLPPRAVEQLRAYLVDLFRRGEPPPARGRGLDRPAIAAACGVEPRLLEPARETLRPGLEALRRELRKPVAKPRTRATPRSIEVAPSPAQQPAAKPPRRRGAHLLSTLDPLPEPDEPWQDTPAFSEALDLHMRRHHDTAPQLCKALRAQGLAIEPSTLRAWRRGRKAPSHVESFAVLQSLEQRWRLPSGYFKDKLPHPARAAKGHEAGGLGQAERRRLAWHLPDDFDRRPLAEREEILEWVRRVVVSGATEYRRYQAGALKHGYAVRFPVLHRAQSARARDHYSPGAV